MEQERAEPLLMEDEWSDAVDPGDAPAVPDQQLEGDSKPPGGVATGAAVLGGVAGLAVFGVVGAAVGAGALARARARIRYGNPAGVSQVDAGDSRLFDVALTWRITRLATWPRTAARRR